MKTLHLVEVDSVLVNPHALYDEIAADSVMLREQAVVDGRQPIVRPGNTFRNACATCPGSH